MKRWMPVLLAVAPVLLFAGCAGLGAALASPAAPLPPGATVFDQIRGAAGSVLDYWIYGSGLASTGGALAFGTAKGAGAIKNVGKHAASKPV